MTSTTSASDFARISLDLASASDEKHTLDRVVGLAVETIEGCEMAGISLLHAGGRVDTPAATNDLVQRADNLQYELKQGPCLEAIWGGDDTYVIADMTTETRWPDWAPRAAELRIRSILSVRLSTSEDLIGGLNLYSTELASYDEDDVATAHIYAAHAAAILALTRDLEGVKTAMQTRHLIGLAQGILMQRFGVDEPRAFAIMQRHSNNTNAKLRDVAAQIVKDRGLL